MTITTAKLKTPNAQKYITQLCKHWSHRFDVTFDDTTGRVALPGGPVDMHATDDALEITITLTDEAARARMQQVVAEHLERFAFREAPLSFNWS